MFIRLATIEDLPQIEEVYASARQFMRDSGNASQWTNGYPSREMLEEDIQRETLYVIEQIDNSIHAVFYFALEDDPTYEVIEDGAWLNDEPYGVIHRIASDGKIHGVVHIVTTIFSQQVDNIRVDTHENNTTMQHVLEREGFERCGTIYCHDGTPRIAYQKVCK